MDTYQQYQIFQESDSFTCGPSCLAMIYKMKGKTITVADILKDFHQPQKGKATYVPQLARHLNKNGIRSRVVISTSQVLSPAWKNIPKEELIENIKAWISVHPQNPWVPDVQHLLFYIQEGGEVGQESYTVQTIKDMIDRDSFVILCIDEDWVWEHRLKIDGDKRVVDEIEGGVEGHYIIAYDYGTDYFCVMDPFPTNIEGKHGQYNVDMNQLVNASLT